MRESGTNAARLAERYGIWLLVAVVLVVGLATVDDYGATTDEPWRMLWTRRWWAAFASGSTARFAEMPQNYGVLYDSIGRGLWLVHESLGGTDEFLARHTLNLLSGCLALIGTHHLARELLRSDDPAPTRRSLVPLVAAVLLAACPRFYGSMFTNPKDIPFATATVWAAWGAIRLVRSPSRATASWAAVLAGVCASIRPHGVVFFFIVPAAVLVGDRSARGWLRVCFVGVVAYAVVLVLWPVLWAQPPWHLLTASLELTRHDHGSQTLFAGQLYPFWDAPALYVVGWLAITLPPAVALLAPVGLGVATSTAVRERRAISRWFGWALLGAWVVAPAVLPMVRRTTLYDAARQLQFMVPALCIFAALGWASLRRRSQRARWSIDVTVLAMTLGAVVRCITLHPYQAVYVSGLAGGLQGAHGRFDVAHYSETYREAFRWLRDNHRGAAVHVVGNGSAVASFYAWKYGLDLNPQRFEFFVSEVRQGWETTLPGEVVHEIEREGVPLLQIRRVAAMQGPRVAWLRPGAFESNAPTDPADEGWTRLDGDGGRFDVGAHLRGGPGTLAIELRSSDPSEVTLLSCHYLGATVVLDDRVLYSAPEVPFHYRGTENFPSLLPLRTSMSAGRHWLLVDVSNIRQAWKYGVYAPARADLFGHHASVSPERPSTTTFAATR